MCFWLPRFRGNNLERNIDIRYIAIEVVRFQFGLVRFSLEPSWDPNALKFSCWWKHQYLCNQTLPTQIFDAISGATKHLWIILLAIWVISDRIEKKNVQWQIVVYHKTHPHNFMISCMTKRCDISDKLTLAEISREQVQKKLPGSVTECQKTSIINCIPSLDTPLYQTSSCSTGHV